jgi:hypothetical protein
VAFRLDVIDESANRNVDVEQIEHSLPPDHAREIFAALKAFVCRFRRRKRVGFVLEP